MQIAMRHLLSLIIALSLTFSATSHADQAYYIKSAVAARALKMVSRVTNVRHFCYPCGNVTSTLESIESVEIGEIKGEFLELDYTRTQYWELLINGKPVDLAYVYVPIDEHWHNLAMLIAHPVRGVPPVLTDEQINNDL